MTTTTYFLALQSTRPNVAILSSSPSPTQLNMVCCSIATTSQAGFLRDLESIVRSSLLRPPPSFFALSLTLARHLSFSFPSAVPQFHPSSIRSPSSSPSFSTRSYTSYFSRRTCTPSSPPASPPSGVPSSLSIIAAEEPSHQSTPILSSKAKLKAVRSDKAVAAVGASGGW
jgi:hypothetical protein